MSSPLGARIRQIRVWYQAHNPLPVANGSAFHPHDTSRTIRLLRLPAIFEKRIWLVRWRGKVHPRKEWPKTFTGIVCRLFGQTLINIFLFRRFGCCFALSIFSSSWYWLIDWLIKCFVVFSNSLPITFLSCRAFLMFLVRLFVTNSWACPKFFSTCYRY